MRTGTEAGSPIRTSRGRHDQHTQLASVGRTNTTTRSVVLVVGFKALPETSKKGQDKANRLNRLNNICYGRSKGMTTRLKRTIARANGQHGRLWISPGKMSEPRPPGSSLTINSNTPFRDGRRQPKASSRHPSPWRKMRRNFPLPSGAVIGV